MQAENLTNESPYAEEHERARAYNKLIDAEHEELLRLTKQVEAFDVARIEALSQLAARHGVTLSALMRQLGIESPADE